MIGFYHSADLDGHCSGAILRYVYPGIRLYGADYGKPFPWEVLTDPDEHVLMVDFSLQPWEDMERLASLSRHVTWIDHHKTAIEEYERYERHTDLGWQIVLDTNHAACELTWKALFRPECDRLPLSVYWLGRYDIWKHADVPGSLEFQYGMRVYDTRPENQELWASLFQSDDRTRAIRDSGEGFLLYEKAQNAKFARAYAFETTLDGLRCIALNRGMTSSLIFESVYDPKRHDAMIAFAFRDGRWTVSLYSDKPDVDVGATCKKWGGGGHKGAAGFQCEGLPFLSEHTEAIR